jgi:hypothetical protein
MTKKAAKIKDIDIEFNTKKVRVKAVKKDKKVDVVVDTPKVDVELHIDETKKEFKYDGQKLDVNVIKTEEGTTVTVDAQNSILKKIGNWLAKFYTKKFNKTK